MPVIKTVSVKVERKINLELIDPSHKFESILVGCDLWADIREEEDEAEAMKELWAMARNNVRAQALSMIGKAAEDIFLGLPANKPEIKPEPIREPAEEIP